MYKYELDEAQMLAANRINNIGHFIGKNVMGKIIKFCSLSLYYDQVTTIDYQLLSEKKLFVVGKSVEFIRYYFSTLTL